jgi:hypothetical protein
MLGDFAKASDLVYEIRESSYTFVGGRRESPFYLAVQNMLEATELQGLTQLRAK